MCGRRCAWWSLLLGSACAVVEVVGSGLLEQERVLVGKDCANFQIAVHRGDEPAEVREAEVVFEIDLRKVVLDDRADVVRVAALDLVLEARERVFGFSQSVLAILLVERLLEVDQAAESC
jgi:hypothetical protein